MRWIAASLLALAACSRTTYTAPAAILSPGNVEEPVTAVIAAALDADRRLEPADSLYEPEAAIVANGQMRYAPPRFAGVEPGGEVAITSTRVEVRQSLVWVFLEYRWISLREGAARDGRATVLLVPRADGAGWRILHLHSSTSG